MFIDNFKFDIEKIADKILEHIEELLVEKASIANDFTIMQEQFGKINALKQKLKLDSIDIVFVWENKGWDELFDKESYKAEISEIYNRINYKLGMSKKVPTYFRSAEGGVPAFHFPANMNVWFLTVNNFVKSKIKPIIVINFGVENFKPFLEKYDPLLKNELKYYFVECNKYFDMDKHVEEAWNKK